MCHRQLADYQANLSEFTDQQVRLIAISVDDIEDARELRDKHDLGFDVGYGLDGRAVAELTGGFFDETKGFLHAASFVIDGDNKIAVSVYSSGSVGRLVPKDALRLISYLRPKSA